ncbi:hypothetical protein SDC9_137619 [bioreactor metagenome]|uniref:Uncharacterized protein n=1 Tax=bioreactor metagenome TaxID=1076179 RepID=A0A645DN17_9ZZZZ
MVVVAAGIHLVIAVVEVPAVNIVYIAVAVVVHAVSGNLTLVDPEHIFQILVGVIHAGVDEGHDHITTAVVFLPGVLDVDVDSAYRRCGLRRADSRAPALHSAA